MFQALLAAAVLVVLGGCTQFDGERRAAIRTAAVIAAVPDEFTMTKVGVIAFGNTYDRDRSEWGFEAGIRQSITQFLRDKRPDVTVVPLQYKPQELLAQLQGPTRTSDVKPDLVARALNDIVAGKQIDTLFLVTPAAVSMGPVYFQGIGMETSVTVRDLAPFKLFAILEMHVIDVPSMKILTSTYRHRDGTHYNLNRLLYPDSQAPTFPSGFTMPLNDAQKSFLQPQIPKLIDETSRGLMENFGLW